ncbi:hypothetical protein AMELA_G00269540 [Ameiurus melas]|uniref:Uncharacterized protein n=1 Tax=Ameiurus melas TaxID=219545 RepID=A0A7J5ZQI8_AMEME|nr:hypothetical protein AMELA_G00269540 [Ameiurus melas]
MKTKEVQKKVEEKYKVLENKMKNAEAERENELKAAQQKLNQAKSRADAFNKGLKERQQPYYTSWDSSNSGPWDEAGDVQHFVPDPQKQDFTPITQGQAYYSLPAQPYYESLDSSNSGPWAEAGDIQHVVSAPHVYHQEQDFTPITQGQEYYSLPAQPYYPSWDTISCSGPWLEAGDLPHPIPSSHVYHQEQIFTPSAQGQQRELPGTAALSEDQNCSFMPAKEEREGQKVAKVFQWKLSPLSRLARTCPPEMNIHEAERELWTLQQRL